MSVHMVFRKKTCVINVIRAIRYYIKYPRKYKAKCICGCEFVGYSNRARKTMKKLPPGKHKGIVFKVRP